MDETLIREEADRTDAVIEKAFSYVLRPVKDRERGGATNWNEDEFTQFVFDVYDALNTPKVHSAYTSALMPGHWNYLCDQAAQADELGHWLGGMIPIAESYERLARAAMLEQKVGASSWTDTDRKIRVQAFCNRATTLRSLLQQMYDATYTRISLCQSMIRRVEQEETQVSMGRSK